MVMANHKECIQVCIRSCVGVDKNHPRIVRISDTLHLERLMLSEAYWSEAEKNPGLEIEGELFDLVFDEYGNLFL